MIWLSFFPAYLAYRNLCINNTGDVLATPDLISKLNSHKYNIYLDFVICIADSSIVPVISTHRLNMKAVSIGLFVWLGESATGQQ